MRQVKRRPILSYFYADKERKRNVRHFPFLFRQSHKLNPLSLTVFICLCFCVAGFYSVLSLAAGISLLSLLVIVYFHTKASANNLYVTRKVSSCQIFQGEKVQVGLTLINTSVGRSACVTLKDKFSASEDEIVEFYFPEGLKAKTKVKKYYEKECDGGVGVKDIGPTVLEVSDGFGLFHFTVHDDQIDQLEVLPRIGSLPEAPLKGSLNSAVYGNYEVEQRGYSVKLQGIREYAHGDSLKHVAWKITAKHNEIMVKEFDRMVNSNVYVAANDHPTLHIGKKQHSTWEVTREICRKLRSISRGRVFIQSVGSAVHF